MCHLRVVLLIEGVYTNIGQLTSYHDCLLHNRDDAELTAFMDLDELPAVHNSEQPLVDWIRQQVHPLIWTT